jgi:hypothetical protein
MPSDPDETRAREGKISRRQMVGIAASVTAASVVVKLAAQAPPATDDFDAAARQSHRANSATLAQFDVPQSLEPAFVFRA